MEPGGVLLIGNTSRVFSDRQAAKTLPCAVCEDFLNGIETAATGNFDVVAVVMSGQVSKYTALLKTLRKHSVGARVVLVAQMYDEPAAIELVGASNGQALADDYLVCPIATGEFCKLIAGGAAEAKAPAGVILDSAAQARIRHLEKLATEDDLTGLKNRRYIWEFARQIIERARRDHGRVTLLLFDIDDLKHYNDAYGHTAGDEVLRQAAQVMRRCCRRHDVVARIGGDEFAVLFWDDPRGKAGKPDERRSPAAAHPSEVIAIARRFRKELEGARPKLLGPDGRGALTISGGLAGLKRDGETIEELFAQADNALLEAKRSGKNRIYLVGGEPAI